MPDQHEVYVVIESEDHLDEVDALVRSELNAIEGISVDASKKTAGRGLTGAEIAVSFAVSVAAGIAVEGLMAAVSALRTRRGIKKAQVRDA